MRGGVEEEGLVFGGAFLAAAAAAARASRETQQTHAQSNKRPHKHTHTYQHITRLNNTHKPLGFFRGPHSEKSRSTYPFDFIQSSIFLVLASCSAIVSPGGTPLRMNLLSHELSENFLSTPHSYKSFRRFCTLVWPIVCGFWNV